jgi:uncharacterized protein YxjI
MKKKLFSLRRVFRVMNEEQQDVLAINRLFGFNKFVIEDMQGVEQVMVRQRVFALRRTFEIYSNGHYYACVKKPFFAFLERYTVELYNNDEYRIEGDFFSHEYNIYSLYHGGVASVSKQWLTLTDTYGVLVNDGADAALILACVLIIDICHPSNQ